MVRAIFLMLISFQAIAKDNCEPEFNKFISKFSSDIQFQHSSIQYPLPTSYLDMMADPEPAPVYEVLSKSQVEKNEEPIFPIKRAGLEQRIEQNGSSAVLILRKPDTGIRLVYTFNRLNNCWLLIKYDDEST